MRLPAEGQTSTSPVVGSDDAPAGGRDRRVLAIWRKHPGRGPSQIRNQLGRDGLKISTYTVRVATEEHGYTPLDTWADGASVGNVNRSATEVP